MIRAALLALAAAPAAAQHAAPEGAPAPYAGQETREIASLSAEDVAQIEAGAGWGLAKAAEFNGWPGPAHVLENADALGLTEDQRDEVQAIWEAMTAEARALGAELIAAEAALDAAFEAGEVSGESLGPLVMAAAEAEGRLRARHLAAHLEAGPVLSRHQRMIYGQIRGYGGGHDGHGGH